MSNYLFVHFRETTSPEGEQVYFAISRDGFHWESLNITMASPARGRVMCRLWRII